MGSGGSERDPAGASGIRRERAGSGGSERDLVLAVAWESDELEVRFGVIRLEKGTGVTCAGPTRDGIRRKGIRRAGMHLLWLLSSFFSSADIWSLIAFNRPDLHRTAAHVQRMSKERFQKLPKASQSCPKLPRKDDVASWIHVLQSAMRGELPARMSGNGSMSGAAVTIHLHR